MAASSAASSAPGTGSVSNVAETRATVTIGISQPEATTTGNIAAISNTARRAIAEVWQWTPFMFIILLAALANVEREQLEAAEIDGAGRLRVFFRIILPAILPVLSIALLIRALDLFRIFDAVWQLTRGGPGNKTETVSIFMYIRGFQSFETSYTAALVVVLLILLSLAVTLALKRMEIAR
jgi:multiple sugar transport system permease protein